MGEVKQINIKNRTYYFYNDIIDLKNFLCKVVKYRQKKVKKALIVTTLDTSQLMIVKLFTV